MEDDKKSSKWKTTKKWKMTKKSGKSPNLFSTLKKEI